MNMSCYNCGASKCPECHCCHGCSSSKVPAVLKKHKPRTQKAKGLEQLRGLSTPYDAVDRVVQVEGLIQSKDDLDHFLNMVCFFARPCPKRPRHGFVDSRVVRSIEELSKVVEETFAADPTGEVMLCPPLDAAYNTVWTPSLLTVGKGNDGATAGTGCVMIPLVGKVWDKLNDILAAAGVGAGEEPYIETVTIKDTHQSILTQLRAGPALGAGTKNFVPAPFEVKEVIKAEGDLLAWEAACAAMKDKAGIVVWHPGGSLTDHYSVHCRALKIPILIDGKQPSIGDWLEPEGDVKEYDGQAVLEGLEIGAAMTITGDNAKECVHFLLTALYNSAAMTGKDGKWLGVGIALLLRLGSTACAGEARHAKSSAKPDRGSVYERMYKVSLTRHHQRIIPLIGVLRYAFPAGKVGVGGENWAKCGATLLPLFNGVRALALSPTDENVRQLILAYNVAVDQAHNGGWWLNKFASASAFNQAQAAELGFLTSFPELIWDVGHATSDGKAIARWQKWHELEFVPPAVERALMVSDGNTGTADFQVSLRGKLFKATPRTISIPAKEILNKLGKTLLSNVYVVEGKGGIRIEARGMGEPVVLYEESDLKTVKARSEEKK